MTDYSALTDLELLEKWDMESSFIQRDKLLQTMRERHLFPGQFQSEWETTSGAYPTMDDPNFIQKLLERREFAESYQSTATEPENDPCFDRGDEGFQLSPVQRFVANFMSPKTPFNSMLLYHGVGVGKTCSAVQIAEQWLNFYPNRRVIILAPPTIKSGIENNIFDINKVRFGANENEPNTADQCTGTIYMELTNTLYERNHDTILRKVRRKINQRYLITGYLSFAYKLREILSNIPERFTGEERTAREVKELQDVFDGTLLIIDEAHNLRDNPEEGAQAAVNVEDAESDAKHSDEKAGKILTPYLRQLLTVVNGMKLVLMTATPMYNSYREIIHMMNLILLNEKMGEINEPQIFNPDGTFRDGGIEILGGIARRYISYMRGENPDIFPLRLNPSGTLTIAQYPSENPRRFPLGLKDRSYINYLPIVPVTIGGDLLALQQQMMDGLQEGGAKSSDEISVFQLVSIIEAGICIVPPVTEEQAADFKTSAVYELQDRVSKTALGLHFYRQTVGGEIVFKAKGLGRAAWLAEASLPQWAPKIAKVLSSVKTSAGVCFIYSRFVSMGAQPIALALEANGYTAYGRTMPLLADGPQSPGGRQCALCDQREEGHVADHAFAPAYYVLLTGDGKLSPDNKGQIAVARADDNKDGRIIKVIVGSSVTAEGVDLRFIREIHIMESWYHLNKLEQVIGRGIRTFSHCLLPVEQRNCTVYMYANVMPASDLRETVDLYSYRKAYKKARLIGAVSRVLKTFAVDCNLNHDSIIIRDREPRTLLNSQGEVLENVSVDDKPHTAICDWLDSCDYECIPKVAIEPDDSSEVSYDVFTARWHQAEMKKVIRALFSYGNNVAVPEDAMATLLGKYPRIARLELLAHIINNKSFIVVNNGREGYIIYKNGLYLFQPFAYEDRRIPRAVRMSSYPVRQDSYSPALISLMGPETEMAAAATNNVEVIPVAIVDPIKLLTVVSAWQQWSRALAAVDTVMPATIVNWFDEQLGGDKKDLDRRLNRLLMIRWVAQSLREADIDADTIERLLLEYLFDEEMTTDERYAFFINKELQDIGHKLSPSQIYDMKGNGSYIYMYVSTDDGQLKYICDAAGNECSPALQDLINETYSLKKLNVSVANTGFLYGLLAPNKNGFIVFKTTEPPTTGVSGQKLKTGAECQIISKTSHLVRKAVLLGERLTAGGHSNLGFTDEVLDQSNRKIKNTQQICTVTNLILRYMDIIGFENKKWFFRPVDAFMTGHRVSIKSK